MSKLTNYSLRKLNFGLAIFLAVFMVSSLIVVSYTSASATSSWTQVIGSGTLSVDIVDAATSTIASPYLNLDNATFSFTCQATTGTFSTSTQQIYIQNPDAADGGWSVTLAAANPANVWDGAASDFDFNDPTGSGCTDGADAGDTVGGQMTVDPSAGVIMVGDCAACSTANVSAGSSFAFSEGVKDDITIVTGAAGSDDVGDWAIRTISISQTIPAEQGAASDYTISMVLSIATS